MIETIGKKLCHARLARGLSIDEAAHATRVRPEKLIALENDDYSRFGSNAYAKGFLQIYGRFLGVDVSDQASALETPRHVTISDYQYLNNAPEPETTRISSRHHFEPRRPSVMPLLIFLGLMLVALIGVVGIWVNVNMQRLESPKATSQTVVPKPQNALTPSPIPAANSGTPAPSLALSSDAALANAPLSDSGLVAIGEQQSQSSPDAAKLDITTGTNAQGTQLPSSDQTAAGAASPGVVTTSPGVNELILQPLKTTWVKVRRDSASGESIFEGDIYPNTRPLKLHGTRFFVEVRDQDAVQIRKNGHPIAYQAPGISIQ